MSNCNQQSCWPKFCTFILIFQTIFIFSANLYNVYADPIQVSKAIIQCDLNNDLLKQNDYNALWSNQNFTSKASPSVYKKLKISPLKLCTKYKLSLTLELKNNFDEDHTDPESNIILVDHAEEPEFGHQISFGSPLAFKLQQGPVFQIYPLHYVSTVNAQPKEILISGSNISNFHGCEDFSNSSPCDLAIDESTRSSYTLGYCCSYPSAGDIVHCYKESEYWYGIHELGPPSLFHQVFIQMYQLVEVNSNNSDTRRSSPGEAEVTWVKYANGNESGDIHIDSIGLSSYEGEIGTEGDKLKITYSEPNANKVQQSGNSINQYLNAQDHVVLIPIPHTSDFEPTIDVANSDEIPIPLLQKQSVEESVLVVPKIMVNSNEVECGKVGAGFQAFLHQPKQCKSDSAKGGSCFQNQPFDLWTQEQYRLKHYGPIHVSSPIKIIGNVMNLVMEHEQGPTTSQLQLELTTAAASSSLELIQPEMMILSATVDSSLTHGKFIVDVANIGWIPSDVRIKLIDCEPIRSPKDKLAWRTIISTSKRIPAQKVITFTLDNIPYYQGYKNQAKKLVEKNWCNLFLLNSAKEEIAARKLLLSPADTCICYYTCECTCAKDSLGCIKLETVDMIAAGFNYEMLQEEIGLEQPISASYSDFFKSARLHPIPIIIIVFLALLFLGFFKGILGSCCINCNCTCCGCSPNALSKLGLGYFYNRPRRLVQYYEGEYSRQSVVYDENGLPLDPVTRQPTVERLSSKEYLAYNTVLFIAWPFICCHSLIDWCCSTNLCGTMRDEDEQRAKRKRRKKDGGKKHRLIFKGVRNRNYKKLPTNDEADGENGGIELGVMDNRPAADDPAATDTEDEIVLYDRASSRKSVMSTKEYRQQHGGEEEPTPAISDYDIDQERRAENPPRRWHEEDDRQQFKQYGLDFFMDSSIGSSNYVPSRNDSTMSMSGGAGGAGRRQSKRESAGLDYKFGKTREGQQEFLAKVILSTQSPTISTTSTTNSPTASSSSVIPQRSYGSWHNVPSSWSLTESYSNAALRRAEEYKNSKQAMKKVWSNSSEVNNSFK